MIPLTISIISNVILALVTVASLYVAYNTFLLSKSFNDKQLSIYTDPQMHARIFRKKKKIFLELSCFGSSSINDVDLLVVSVHYGHDRALIDFIDKYLSKAYEYKVKEDKDGFYHLYDRLYYPAFPVKKKVVAPLFFVDNPDQIFVLMQHRDVFGNNYAREYWFTESLDDPKTDKIFKLTDMQPAPITKVSRLDFRLDVKTSRGHNGKNIYKSPKLFMADGSKLPDFLNEFSSMIEHSFPAGFLRGNTSHQIEDRGIWNNI